MTETKQSAYAGQLLEDVFSAYFKARRHKRNTASQLEFEMDLESNLMRLYEELAAGSYKPGPSYCFIVERPVKREVFASQFRDRVVHHLLFDYINPIFERRFIHDCYSCREGKGTSEGIRRIEHHIRSCTRNYTVPAWILKLDLRGYFMSIDKAKLYDIVSDTLNKHWQKKRPTALTPSTDPAFIDRLLRLVIFKDPKENVIIRHDAKKWEGLPPTKSLLHTCADKGLTIGDLTSQLFSNIYMGEFDRYVKHTLHVKHYGRYVDDFYVVHPSKGYLRELIGVFRRFLAQRLGLTLHPGKIYLQPCSKGVPYLGAFIKPHRRYPSRRAIGQFRRTMTDIHRKLRQEELPTNTLHRIRASLNSYLGYLGNFRSRRLVRQGIGEPTVMKYFDYLPDRNKVMLKKHCPRYDYVPAKWDYIAQPA
ncbi:Retron-type reverse transcriptase [Alistipes sp. cv1]|uniref:RNA-directed DNA polymerase n=2 Tax=Bacteroidales TaxID=171549 RepID=UPI0006C709A7|nr:Retron-type reverse transcriptase [Faecalibacterium prausnitzii]